LIEATESNESFALSQTIKDVKPELTARQMWDRYLAILRTAKYRGYPFPSDVHFGGIYTVASDEDGVREYCRRQCRQYSITKEEEGLISFRITSFATRYTVTRYRVTRYT